FKGRVIVAKVDMAENRELVDRFKVKECPHIIYFRQGKMYRYDLPKLDAASLRSFLDGFYKNSKAENVPIPKSKL
ncbi:thioredoxin domain-containing protein, partial [Plakobranchus ocellatus]